MAKMIDADEAVEAFLMGDEPEDLAHVRVVPANEETAAGMNIGDEPDDLAHPECDQRALDEAFEDEVAA